MQSKRFSRPMSILLTIIMLIALVAPASAATKPAASSTRLDAEFEAMYDSIYAFMGEGSDSAAWKDDAVQEYLSVLLDVKSDADIALANFAAAEKIKNCDTSGKSKTDVWYLDTNFNAKVYGMFRTIRERTQNKDHGAFSYEDGRFGVKYFLNAKMNNKNYFKFWNKEQNRYWNINKDDKLVGLLDYAQGKNFIYLQYAITTGATDDNCKDVFDVYRIMIGSKHVYMAKLSFTESKLLNNRVKSAFTSWDSFSMLSQQRFEYNGSTLKVIDGASETVYVVGGGLKGEEAAASTATTEAVDGGENAA